MEINKLTGRLKWMLHDLEKAQKAGITDAKIKALFNPSQAKLAYWKPGKQNRIKELPLNMDYSVDITSEKDTVTLVIHECMNL